MSTADLCPGLLSPRAAMTTSVTNPEELRGLTPQMPSNCGHLSLQDRMAAATAEQEELCSFETSLFPVHGGTNMDTVPDQDSGARTWQWLFLSCVKNWSPPHLPYGQLHQKGVDRMCLCCYRKGICYHRYSLLQSHTYIPSDAERWEV
ncbi:hypothetical protein AV530_019310 [Patagioenas fasciata monilis]|uniref:Vinculin-binding site-containing domain-containing protein n=1 Tax=Patagioenas fasciata monilis TaxID=372326 RepID=A0A1V4JE77_PATFA|nr:hypothetical protein AV530_019310 [Patagioenas fasciata monilis]